MSTIISDKFNKSRLELASNGKSQSQGGLNVDDIKVYLTNCGHKDILMKSRSELNEILKKELSKTQIPFVNPQVVKVQVPSSQISSVKPVVVKPVVVKVQIPLSSVKPPVVKVASSQPREASHSPDLIFPDIPTNTRMDISTLTQEDLDADEQLADFFIRSMMLGAPKAPFSPYEKGYDLNKELLKLIPKLNKILYGKDPRLICKSDFTKTADLFIKFMDNHDLITQKDDYLKDVRTYTFNMIGELHSLSEYCQNKNTLGIDKIIMKIKQLNGIYFKRTREEISKRKVNK